MDCHLNCHGELNALVLALPVIGFAVARVRARWRAWRGTRVPGETVGDRDRRA